MSGDIWSCSNTLVRLLRGESAETQLGAGWFWVAGVGIVKMMIQHHKACLLNCTSTNQQRR